AFVGKGRGSIGDCRKRFRIGSLAEYEKARPKCFQAFQLCFRLVCTVKTKRTASSPAPRQLGQLCECLLGSPETLQKLEEGNGTHVLAARQPKSRKTFLL